MKKVIQPFILWLLVGLLAVTAIPIVIAQSTPSSTDSGKAPVTLDGETLFVFTKPLGTISVEERAKNVSRRLQQFADSETLSVDDMNIDIGDTEGVGIPITAVSVGNIPLITITKQDALAATKSRSVLVKEYVEIIKDAVTRYREKRTFQNTIRSLIFAIIATIISLVILFIIQNVFAKINQKLDLWGTTYIQPVRIGTFELIKANQLDNVVHFIARIIQIIAILGLVVAYCIFVLSQFIWTRSLAATFVDYLSKTFQTVWQAFINYVPNLLVIITVILIAWFFLRVSKTLFDELRQENISLPGFYPEWALPTYRLVTTGIVVLAAIIIVPLLPGFNSPAFQGISVFLGLLFSLGSTSVIANVVSGTILIYTRAFRVGDYITIGDTTGQVLETTLLVTRILTVTNVVISIPNSEIITTSISNWSFSSQELNLPLIVRTPVYLGYEVPWKQAYNALIQAAVQTKGISQSPPPFVIQEALNEVYVTYQLSVYVNWEYFKGKSLKEFEQTRSKLHENIRECCQEAGIRIFAPSYEADPTNYGPAAVNEE
ncbi:MscS Mechanosensitive ion channel [Rippkaea orientalis PCC 8801]|uniref:MscS Mechanosensitive ion channel n=1 Tax=Rippkaea orientalis (strain PCC 8801 / RF-1) TaxID=41431 RepID=B7JV12_RIPO1|nr:mechanosensitive ion channel domain-containing protein [Rippkaea orientalis]ACK66864.1 MscS Mechanosensitive ion channel [Rippkaea orientalis PCC 8801]